jgi:hypothetical protein
MQDNMLWPARLAASSTPSKTQTAINGGGRIPLPVQYRGQAHHVTGRRWSLPRW